MATSTAGNLDDEFSCPICLNEMVRPKLVGSCHHSVCCKCLEELVRVRYSQARSFPCPFCKSSCPIPEGGVKNLKSDFKLESIIERYRTIKENAAGIECNACENAASHLCKACENIFLCPTCAKKHDMDPLTSEHELIGICRKLKHGKTLSMFCSGPGCNCAICSVCVIKDHPSYGPGHCVKKHREVVKEETKTIGTAVTRLRKCLESKRQDMGSLVQKYESIDKRIGEEVKQVDTKSGSIKKQIDLQEFTVIREHVRLTLEKLDLEKQLEEVNERLKTMDECLDEDRRKRDNVEQERFYYCEVLDEQRTSHQKSLQDAMACIDGVVDEIKEKIDRGSFVESSSSRVLDDTTVPNLVALRDELQAVSDAAENVEDTVQPFRNIEKEMRFEPSEDPMELGKLVVMKNRLFRLGSIPKE